MAKGHKMYTGGPDLAIKDKILFSRVNTKFILFYRSSEFPAAIVRC